MTITLAQIVADEKPATYYLECAQLATTLRRQAAEREANQKADNLRVLEGALWTAYVERHAREESGVEQ